VLKSILEVLILPTLKMPREICSVPESQTSLLLEKERSQSLLSSQERELKEDLKKKEMLNKKDTIDIDCLKGTSMSS
jgi:hypothetical protein